MDVDGPDDRDDDLQAARVGGRRAIPAMFSTTGYISSIVSSPVLPL
jgi:hypothetical protein